MASRRVPQVVIIADTKMDYAGLDLMFDKLGVGSWDTKAQSDSEYLMEVVGKFKGLAYEVDVEKGRKPSNLEYLVSEMGMGNLAPLRHATVTVVILECSMHAAHEMARICNNSVVAEARIKYGEDQLYYEPTIVNSVENYSDGLEAGVGETIKKMIREEVERQQDFQNKLADLTRVNELLPGKGFALKSRLMSAFRRLLGSNRIGYVVITASHAAWRSIIQQRTRFEEEEEVRLICGDLFKVMKVRYPGVYGDSKEIYRDDFCFGVPQVEFR